MESTTLLKDILLDKGQIHKYYEGMVPVNLWRGLNVKKNMELFELIEDTVILSNGRPRPADISLIGEGANAKINVKESPRGISTFDKPGIPQGPNWEHYRISAGTSLPKGLAIIKDNYNSRLGAYHYTIAPAYDMPLTIFKILLSQLAKSVVKEVA